MVRPSHPFPIIGSNQARDTFEPVRHADVPIAGSGSSTLVSVVPRPTGPLRPSTRARNIEAKAGGSVPFAAARLRGTVVYSGNAANVDLTVLQGSDKTQIRGELSRQPDGTYALHRPIPPPPVPQPDRYPKGYLVTLDPKAGILRVTVDRDENRDQRGHFIASFATEVPKS